MPDFPDFNFEKSLLPSGTRYLLGIDEVGRGPLAGPVTIGAFLLDLHSFSPDEFIKLGVRDSKKLSESQRKNIHRYFLQNNFKFHTFSCSSTDIDRQGIATCLRLLITKALKQYSTAFDFCLIDGLPLKQISNRSNNNYQIERRSEYFSSEFQREALDPNGEKCSRGSLQFVVKGDSQCFSIASASIVAKVDRDREMDKFHVQFPHYGFNRNRGYGTKKHLDALKLHGPCQLHRKSYQPIIQMLDYKITAG